MLCNNCGATIDEESAFCKSCGAKLKDSIENTQNNSANENVDRSVPLFDNQDYNNLTQSNQGQKSTLSIVLGIIGIVLVFLNYFPGIPVLHLVGLGFGIGAITTGIKHNSLHYSGTTAGIVLGIIAVVFGVIATIIGVMASLIM